ncbi:MAG: ABC transporter ATP-binding protein [Nanobdellota archaeon]
MHALELKEVSKSFGSKKVLDKISMNIKTGKITGIVGKSGSGKTTLLKIIVDYYNYDEGEVYATVENIKKNIGFATQNNCFYKELTVKENMIYFGSMFNIKKKKLIDKTENLLEFVGLEKAKNLIAEKLSGGMSRRLDLAIALINSPKILILDELTAGLDPIARKNICEKIRSLNKEGVTILLSSHMMDEIEELCDNVLLLEEGKIIEEGHPGSLKRKFMDETQLVIKSSPGNYREIIKILSDKNHCIDRYNIDQNMILISKSLPDSIKSLNKALEECGEELLEIEVEKPDMNYVFKNALGGKSK